MSFKQGIGRGVGSSLLKAGALLGVVLSAGCSMETGSAEEQVAQQQDELYQRGALWTGGVVNVCYDGVDGNNAALLKLAQMVLKNTWESAAQVKFVGWGKCDYTPKASPVSLLAVHFKAGSRGSSNLGMWPASYFSANAPNGWSPGVNNLYLVSDDASPMQHFTYEVIHEFGHALGWAHEQERPDNWNAGTALNCDQLDNGRKADPGGIYQTSYFDFASVMDYCNPAGWPTKLSTGDIAGVRKAYGSHIQYTPGDFNGDGKTDVIITTTSGSYWYYSTGLGTWNNAYTRTDLPLGSVEFTTGDFDGNGMTDVILTTVSGSYWHYSTGTGTFAKSYTRKDLPKGSVNYVPGDFDGDGMDDLIITTTSGSYWYYSTGRGTWNNANSRSDLPLGFVAFTPGDFDGNGMTDVIITVKGGSYWHYSTGTGTYAKSYTRNDLVLGLISYVPADFDGDGKTDLIISTPSGSYWYYSTGRGTWTNPYTRNDLLLGYTSFTTQDFNGDGKADVIITNASGSAWNYSTGVGTWNNAYNRSDLPAGAVQYAPGDYSGDGKGDVIITTASGSYWYYSNGTGQWKTPYNRTDLPL